MLAHLDGLCWNPSCGFVSPKDGPALLKFGGFCSGKGASGEGAASGEGTIGLHGSFGILKSSDTVHRYSVMLLPFISSSPTADSACKRKARVFKT